MKEAVKPTKGSHLISAYKYVTAEGGLRFLRGWSLRLTPPAEFNDPFELRPPTSQVFTENYVDLLFRNVAPQMAIDDLTEQLTTSLGTRLSPKEIADIATFIITPSDAHSQYQMLKSLGRKNPGLSLTKLVQIQKQVQAQWPAMMEMARETAALVLPKFNSMVKQGFTEILPELLGVLCLSRNANQPLMWAHYADSHRGMMMEFDTAHPTFNRKRSTDDDFGYLRAVSYTQTRPEMTMAVLDGESAFEVFALTKADQWNYEEEVRLLLPLHLADLQVETPVGKITLLKCPSSAVASITLGCKSSEQSLHEVQQALQDHPDTAHITIRKAELDIRDFKFNYRTV